MGGEKFARWTPVTVEELNAYMGFMILMAIVHLPSIYDYWKKDEIYHYAPIASRISRDRFFKLHRYIHFCDNSSLAPPGSPEYDKLGKIQPIIDMLSTAFYEVFSPQKNLSVDEAMIPFKGRSALKQYMPLKPIKRGIKVWAVSDAVNGFVTAFEIYTGKKVKAERNLGANVVKTLTMHYRSTYRHVYFDNFFTSLDLLSHLLESGLYGCGTIRIDRKGFPEMLKMVAKKGFRERGESQTVQCQYLTVTVWQDSHPVTVVATNIDPTQTVQVLRKNKDGSKVTVKCPQSIALYNKYMGGVDHNDQLRG